MSALAVAALPFLWGHPHFPPFLTRRYHSSKSWSKNGGNDAGNGDDDGKNGVDESNICSGNDDKNNKKKDEEKNG